VKAVDPMEVLKANKELHPLEAHLVPQGGPEDPLLLWTALESVEEQGKDLLQDPKWRERLVERAKEDLDAVRGLACPFCQSPLSLEGDRYREVECPCGSLLSLQVWRRWPLPPVEKALEAAQSPERYAAPFRVGKRLVGWFLHRRRLLEEPQSLPALEGPLALEPGEEAEVPFPKEGLPSCSSCAFGPKVGGVRLCARPVPKEEVERAGLRIYDLALDPEHPLQEGAANALIALERLSLRRGYLAAKGGFARWCPGYRPSGEEGPRVRVRRLHGPHPVYAPAEAGEEELARSLSALHDLLFAVEAADRVGRRMRRELGRLEEPPDGPDFFGHLLPMVPEDGERILKELEGRSWLLKGFLELGLSRSMGFGPELEPFFRERFREEG